ncbi:T-cell-interacting, activating receptor on myeloid cells protein 1 isoform X3 [Gallus gallus]|uniref:T-cell-interacting, activating receptor on myeloid cells protein 1 isoform X3 n=1 Tax=Gallus gallus TaxID=9031 RepID=UPI001AE1238C|nr:T-cell-interacting, activating receptor on myeloid cells protein 1 isoform X3 [Gallus gallus]
MIAQYQEVTSQHPDQKGELTAALQPLPAPSAVSLSPGCSCLTAPMAVALILGWWLVAASRAQQLPRPSLSLHPSQGVSLANNVTLRCHLPRLAAWVWLYQEEGWSYNKGKEKEQDAAEFSFVSTLREHAGRYQCQYRVSWSEEASEKSDPVELVLIDRSFPPPGISLHPEQCVEMGTNITIRCRNKDYGATFLLHKDGSSDPLQCQDSSGGGTATFTLFGVTPADSGTYRCSYRPRGYPFISSPLGDSVTLEVTPTPAAPGAAGSSHGNLVVAVVGGCTAAFVFILVLIVFFLLAARRRRTQRDESPGAPPKKPEAMEFQVPSSDSEGLTYLELQAVTPSTQPPSPPAAPQPSVIYAEVAVRGRH